MSGDYDETFIFDPDSPAPLELEEQALDLPLPDVSFITGPAGTGKTYQMRKRVEEAGDGSVILAATTGIAALNLGTITINSLLGYFDTEDLEDKFESNRIVRKLNRMMGSGIRELVIDEASMLSARQLDILHEAAARTAHMHGTPLRLTLTGDFCQLPPVNEPWAFEASCWPRFEDKVTRLTKIWRQQDATFLEALSQARQGRGKESVDLLLETQAGWKSGTDNTFEGTTIIPKNDEVERFNWLRLERLKTPEFRVAPARWGRQPSEWKWNPQRGTGIPDQLRLREGAYVMLLANDTEFWRYANGSCGHIVGYRPGSKPWNGTIDVELLNGEVVQIDRIRRTASQRDAPEGLTRPRTQTEAHAQVQASRLSGQPYFDWESGRWITGSILYHPIRLAWATTVHKSQGLTLDRVQIDARGHFFGEPNMAYVALSRVRSPEGLQIVATPALLTRRINVAPEVMRWL